MASQVGGLFHDQNLNVHYNGASAGGKSNVSKAPRKGGLGVRKPLGDLSNSVKPTPNQSLKKQNSSIFSHGDKEIGASKSKITIDGSKKKSFSKTSEKVQQTSGRKALSDISNSGKLHVHEASKKNLNAKLSVVADEHLSTIAEEQFQHNHEECIKARTKTMDVDEFLRTIGLDRDFPMQAAPQLKPVSPVTYIELDEIPEEQLEEPCSSKYDQFRDLYTSPSKSPFHLQCMDYDDVIFTLVESP